MKESAKAWNRRNVMLRLGAAGLSTALRPLLRAHALQQKPAGRRIESSPPPLEHQLNALLLTPFVDPLPIPPTASAAEPHDRRSAPGLKITMREIHAQLHRDLPPARLWSYGDQPLGPTIEARSGVPLSVEWRNQLPTKHFLPIDFTLHGCGRDVPEVRNCVHVHGARVRHEDDGYPEDWYVPGKLKRSHYPLSQDAACLWYHDHTMGINRLNLYAGLFGLFIVRDDSEKSLDLPVAPYELPLVLYDRILTRDGQLLYPTSGNPEHPWISEFQGDALLINGKVRPYHSVEARTYRLRLLNASNSRFFSLSLSDLQTFLQIGSDQGLLRQAVPIQRVVLAPGERADILVNFSTFAGRNVYLRTGAFNILEFRVGATAGSRIATTSAPGKLREIAEAQEHEATQVRTITLNEYTDPTGTSMVMLLNRRAWHDEVTEMPKLGSTEIWEFVNQTEDTHPMHLHLVRFRILDRRPFDTFKLLMTKEIRFTAPPEPPAVNEEGWKDVVQCGPGLVTRILVKFEGFRGDYLYHCHILEHEANDMMRPYRII